MKLATCTTWLHLIAEESRVALAIDENKFEEDVQGLIETGKEKGYLTYGDVNDVLPEEIGTADDLDDLMTTISGQGIDLLDTPKFPGDKDFELEEGEDVELDLTPGTLEKTNDPVRMYLREMGTVELLSREGEIAIAKRIEAGREAMIAGLCESPLTFQAVIIWRDELNEGKVFLRDIIDLEATYAGPDAKQVAPAMPPGDGGAAAAAAGVPGFAPQPPQAVAPPSAPPAATPFKPQGAEAGDGEEALPEGTLGEPDLDEDDLENSMSLAAIETELKPKVLETFDTIVYFNLIFYYLSNKR